VAPCDGVSTIACGNIKASPKGLAFAGLFNIAVAVF